MKSILGLPSTKRYAVAMQVKEIRDFRGSIPGRAECGIFLTTGAFTKSAREQAARENAKAIELLEIDRLRELLIEEGLMYERQRR